MWVGLGLKGESSLFLLFLLPPKDIACKVPLWKQKTKPPLDIEPARYFPESRTTREREAIFIVYRLFSCNKIGGSHGVLTLGYHSWL